MFGATKRSYLEDKQWEESWLPYAMKLINPAVFLRQAPLFNDQKQVTDVMISVRDLRIGVRIRYPEHFDNYKHEVTIRCHRDSGAKTEWQKILDGNGDLFFYGFANPGWQHVRCIRRYTLFSLHAIRRVYASGQCPKLPTIDNRDGTYFHPLDVSQWNRLDGKFVVDSNWKVE